LSEGTYHHPLSSPYAHAATVHPLSGNSSDFAATCVQVLHKTNNGLHHALERQATARRTVELALQRKLARGEESPRELTAIKTDLVKAQEENSNLRKRIWEFESSNVRCKCSSTDNQRRLEQPVPDDLVRNEQVANLHRALTTAQFQHQRFAEYLDGQTSRYPRESRLVVGND
jgi:chromosome segregation ATPase